MSKTMGECEITLQQKAIAAMRVMIDRRDAYHKINDEIRKIQPDFPQRVQAIDGKIEEAFVNLLDAILGDTLASYFIYECLHMKDGGLIQHKDGTEYRIKTLEDLLEYVERKK